MALEKPVFTLLLNKGLWMDTIKRKSISFPAGLVIGCFCAFCLIISETDADEQRAEDTKKEILLIGSTIIKKLNEEDVTGKLKTDIWLYDATWITEPNKTGGETIQKSGFFLGTIQKGSNVRILGFKRVVGDYRQSHDVVLKNYKVDFLHIEVLSGEDKGLTGWFRKGSENLVKFSVK